jgi:penicillin-binding protein 1A
MLNNGVYPRNSPLGYDGRMNVLLALTRSKNTASLRTMQIVTPQVSLNFARSRYHLSTLIDSNAMINGMFDGENSLSFGALTKGLSVKEITAAYASFPSLGIYSKPRLYSEVLDKDGNLYLSNPIEREVAISQYTANYINLCLRSVVTSGTGSGARLGDMPAAGKTGTTSADKDRWFVGYTDYYVAGAWFGFEMPRSLRGYTSNGAMVMWAKVMKLVHEDLEPRNFPVPEGLVGAQYCIDSGHKPTAACLADPRGNRVATGQFAPKDVPKASCTLHVVADVCGVSGRLARPDCPVGSHRGLIKTDGRLMPTPTVAIGDEEFTYRAYGVDPYPAVEETDSSTTTYVPADWATFNAKYPPLQVEDGANSFCTVTHQTEPDPDPDPIDPVDPLPIPDTID